MIKSFLNILLGNSAGLVFSVLSGIIITRYLGVEGKGLLTSLLVVPNLLIPFGELGLRQSVIYFKGNDVYNADKLISTLIIISLVTSGLLVAIASFLMDYEYDNTLIALALFYIPISVIGKPISGVYLADGNVKVYNYFNWISSLLKLLGALLLLVAFELGLLGGVVSIVIGLAVMTIWGSIMVLKKYKFKWSYFSFKISKSLLFKGFLFAFSLFLVQLNYRIDIYILDKMEVGSNQIGYYSTGIGLAELIWYVPTIFGVLILSSSKEKDETKKLNLTCKSIRISNLLVTMAAGFVFLFCPLVIELLYGSDFIPSTYVTRTIMIGVIVLNTFKVLNSRFASKGKPITVILITLPALVLNVILNYFFIPKWGIEGAAWASNCSYFISAAGLLLIFLRSEKVKLIDVLFPNKTDFNDILQTVKNKLNR